MIVVEVRQSSGRSTVTRLQFVAALNTIEFTKFFGTNVLGKES